MNNADTTPARTRRILTLARPVRRLATGGLVLATAFASLAVHAGQVQVAVAANFIAPMQAVAEGFAKATGHTATLASGSTGKFYAQIRNGAPFDVFLAADQATPEKLENDGAAVAHSRFTYATGKLVLWSPQAGRVDDQGAVLHEGGFAHIALASPKLAPYGAAAVQTLTALGLLDALAPKFVQGESIGQAFSFVASGNAELGFVALSQVWADGKLTRGSAWVVPATLHQPIRQDAVLLERGKANPAAAALLQYLRSDAARTVIRSFGYDA